MKISRLTAAVAVLMLVSSCSLVRDITARSTSPKGKNTASVTSTTEKVKAPKKHKRKNALQESVQVTDIQKGSRPSDDELSGGEWQVTKAGVYTVDDEDNMPYVVFDPSAGRFYASDGCNIINGDYALRTDGVMTFGHVMSTMKLCPDVEYATAIAGAFRDDSRLTVDTRRIGRETYIVFRDAKGTEVLTIRRHNMEFLNGNWQVTSIAGKESDDPECNIFIDIRSLKVHGNTGCNYFNGELFIDPARANAIDFSKMALTRMSCPSVARETAMMVALEQATTAIAGKNNSTVMLLDEKGRQVMTLKRIDLPEAED